VKVPSEKMGRRESQLLAERVVHYYAECTGSDKKKTCHHFRDEGVPKRTIYGILQRYEASGTAKYRPLPGRPCVKTSPRKLVKVEKAFTKCPNLSVRRAARKLDMAVSTVSRIKVKILGITARTKNLVVGSRYLICFC